MDSYCGSFLRSRRATQANAIEMKINTMNSMSKSMNTTSVIAWVGISVGMTLLAFNINPKLHPNLLPLT